MTTEQANLDCGAVLAELGWLRRLARSLGADAHTAEDLTQATVLAALEHPPRAGGPIRGWLAMVLRNLFRQAARTRVRRRAREARGARGEAVGATADVVERAAVQRRVADAVMALDEPYRTTLLLRYFEGLPPRKIAARTGAPVATVKTRLARALGQLRGRLDAEHGGDRRAWLACLLAPLPQVAVKTAVTGAIIMSVKAKVAGAAAAIVLGVAGWITVEQLVWDRGAAVDRGSPGDAIDQGRAGREQAQREAGAVTPIVTKPFSERDDAPSSTSDTRLAGPVPTEAGTTTAAALRRVRGRVLDLDSSPVASVRVAFRADGAKDTGRDTTSQSESPSAVSGADGVFEIAVPRRPGTIEAQSPRHVTVLCGTFDPAASAVEPIIVVAPVVRIAGRVNDARRRPLSGASVAVELPDGFRARFSQILDYSVRRGFAARTDGEGAFAIDSAPDAPGAHLVTYLEGFEKRSDALSGGPVSDLEIVLRRTGAMPDTITGTVVDHAGVGVPAARVSSRDNTTRTDEGGRFTVRIDGRQSEAWVMALKDGYMPAKLAFDGAAPPSEPVVLRLEGAPLSISGRVVDGDGKALAGVKVWTGDPTLFASTRDEGTQFVENLLGASRERSFWVTIQTDVDGRFTLGGLMARAYRVEAMVPTTLVVGEAGPVKAGSTGVVVTLRGGDLLDPVAGVVVSLTGSPVPNVTVKPQRDTFSFSVDAGSFATAHADAEACVTDEQGRFRLRNVPRQGVHLDLRGSDIIPRSFGRAEGGLEAAASGQDLARLRIQVSVRCHLKIDLGGQPEISDEIAVLDPNDGEVAIELFEGTGRLTRMRVPIVGGTTGVLAVPQDSRTVRFLKDGKEVARKSLRLTPGSVTTVRP